MSAVSFDYMDRAHEFVAYMSVGFTDEEVSEFFSYSVEEINMAVRDYLGETIH